MKSRRLRWAGHVARMEEAKSAFKILTNMPTPTGTLRRRWEDHIRMEISNNTISWAQDRDYWRALVNAALNHKAWSGNTSALTQDNVNLLLY